MGIYAINQSGSVLGNNTTQTGVLQPNLNAGVVTYQNNNAMNESLFTSLQNKSFAEDGHDDGSIGVIGAIKNFGKGIGKLFTGMFCDQDGNISLAQIAKTGLTIGAITLATMLPVVGPLVLPTLCIGGMLHGGFTFLNGLSTALSAKTDAEAERAWQDMGTGATEGVISYIGYKASGGIKQGWEQAKAEYSSFGKSTASVEPKPSGESTGTPKTEPKAEASATPKAEPVVEQPSMTMTDEARIQYNNTKAQIENSRPTVNSEMIDEQFATPKELTEMKAFYEEAEAAANAKVEPVAETPVAEAPATPKVEPAAEQTTSIPVHESRSVHYNNPDIRSYIEDSEYFVKKNPGRANEVIDFVNKTDAQFQNITPLDEPLTTYRGLHETARGSSKQYIDNLYNLKVGEEVVLDNGYSYSAMINSEAGQFAGSGQRGVLIETEFQPGTRVSITNEYGGEVLSQRGMKYVVTEHTVKPDGSLYMKVKNIVPTENIKPLEKPAAIQEFLDAVKAAKQTRKTGRSPYWSRQATAKKPSILNELLA